MFLADLADELADAKLNATALKEDIATLKTDNAALKEHLHGEAIFVPPKSGVATVFQATMHSTVQRATQIAGRRCRQLAPISTYGCFPHATQHSDVRHSVRKKVRLCLNEKAA